MCCLGVQLLATGQSKRLARSFENTGVKGLPHHLSPNPTLQLAQIMVVLRLRYRNNAASCPAASFVDNDGMQAIPACNTLNCAWVYSLVVGGKCFPVGITFFANTAKNCQ